MKRRVLIALVVVLALVFVLSPTALAGRPAEKATGSVELIPVGGSGGWSRYARFNAHEETDGRPAKGVFDWTQTKGSQVILHQVAIDDVTIVGNDAWFSGIATSNTPSRDGLRLYVCVADNATPGSDGDDFSLHWEDQTSFYHYNVVGGNLVVHTYE